MARLKILTYGNLDRVQNFHLKKTEGLLALKAIKVIAGERMGLNEKCKTFFYW